ncbi:HEAT repeat domain-containing protein [uncultured Draconibacterium sp.]|uniref:HEAT repeat domain-containing protein n=1 Tax=uncultured Draconibacterium sp. TaxID=1573823 RepID=UPI002AA918B5|nr:HEAT repeat domain-containing protein [uncultured Draconibacterium sp.]
MNTFSYLYKIGFIRLTKKKVEKWNRIQNIDKLIFALENGLYDIRILAAKYLGNLKDRNAIPVLRKSLNDKVKPVSLQSAESLRRLTNNADIEIEIREKLKYWEEEEEKERNRIISNEIHVDMPKWKKRDWVAIVKEMLKKPMRW